MILKVITCLSMTFMIFLAEFTGEKEIIFPEIAALAMGSILAPKFAWKVNKTSMIFYIFICAVFGTLISCFLQLPLWLKLFFAYFVGQTVFLFSKTTLAPMISAIVLPVMIGTTGAFYPFIAFALTFFTVIVRLLLEKFDLKQKETFDKNIIGKNDILRAILRQISVLPVLYFAVKYNVKFLAAPPLLVAFTELSGKNIPFKQCFKIIFFITLCAFFGAVFRIVFLKAQIPVFHLTFAAILTSVFTVFTANKMKMYLPPAAAMSMLAMLVDEKTVIIYPFAAFTGIFILVVISQIISKKIIKNG